MDTYSYRCSDIHLFYSLPTANNDVPTSLSSLPWINLRGEVFILAGEEMQILIDRNGKWRFDI